VSFNTCEDYVRKIGRFQTPTWANADNVYKVNYQLPLQLLCAAGNSLSSGFLPSA